MSTTAVRTIRPVTTRLEEAGIPYHLTDIQNMWSVTLSGDKVAVLVFHEQGVSVGYHDFLGVHHLGRKIRRMKGVDRVVVLQSTEMKP